MAADLSIHIFEGIDEKDLAKFNSHTLGSKYFDLSTSISPEDRSDLYKKIGNTPNVWIGEVSWLKAILFENGEGTFVPSTVQQIHDMIGEDLPTIDDKLISRIEDCFTFPNITEYSIAKSKDVVDFLKKHKGKKVFTVSW